MKKQLKTIMLLCFMLFVFAKTEAQYSASYAEKNISELTLNEKISILLNQSDKYNINFADVAYGLALYPDNLYKKTPNNIKSTVFPVPFILANSWNKELATRVGMAVAKESAANPDVDVVVAPALNLIRNPLTGNNWAYFSEDPVLTYQMAKSYMEGIKRMKVPFVIKYYGLYNQENQRDEVNVLIDRRTFYEYYMRPFEKICKSMPVWGILTAYPKINGEYVSECTFLIKKLLRNKWNYTGLVLSDIYVGQNLFNQFKAGTNFVLKSKEEQKDSLMQAIRDGRITEEEIDEHLRLYFNMYMQAVTNRPKPAVNMDEQHRLAKEAASESIVLVKNLDDALPVTSVIKRVAFYGTSSYRLIQSPNMHTINGSFSIQAAQYPSLVKLFMESGYNLDPSLANLYVKHLKQYLPEEQKPATAKPGTAANKTSTAKPGAATARTSTSTAKHATATARTSASAPRTTNSTATKNAASKPGTNPAEQLKKDLDKVASIPLEVKHSELEVNKTMAQQYAKTSQMGIIVIGHTNEPGKDRSLEKDYQLSETEINMIKNVCAAYHSWGKKVIVVLNVDGPVDFTSWHEYPDAILLCGMAGEGMAEALFDIITGKTNPSGKLNMVYSKKFEEYPSSHFFQNGTNVKPNSDESDFEEINYSERFRIGYRYFDEHYEQVLYPFGYGLSYTTFAYDKITMQRKADSILVQVRVTNTGKYSGKEVVQLYVSPQRKNLKLEKPLKELKDFAKTKILKPGESQIVIMRFSEYDLSAFDDITNKWVTSAGNYTIKLGASSQDIKLQYPLQLTENIYY